MFEITGEYNSAKVMLPEDEIEQKGYDQIERLCNHKSCEGNDDIVIMPDTHWGKGAPIGLTMPVHDRIVPNLIGVDIGCFVGETKVDTLNGEIEIGKLSKREESFYVYSCERDGDVHIAEAVANKTRKDAKLVNVTLDNGKEIRCTPDHEFMLRDGSFVEAEELSEGTSLMPLYKEQKNNGHTLVYDNENWNKDAGSKEFTRDSVEQINSSKDIDIETPKETEESLQKIDYEMKSNHEVLSVEPLDKKEDVYCLTVPEYGNFALSAGVFVHNCGMAYAKLTDITAEKWNNKEWAKKADEAIRSAVPMGFNVRDEPAMHIVDEFPWGTCEEKLDNLLHNLGYSREDTPEWFDGYGEEYFKNVCRRVGYDVNRAIMSLGSLGGGNHFIEISESDSTGDVYVTLHSGSRGIGAKIAEHWQDQAHQSTFKRESIVEIPLEEWKYFDGENLGDSTSDYIVTNPNKISIDREAILEDYEGESIEGKFGQLKNYMKRGKEDKSNLDWLEGKEAIGYYIDMIFAQTYAYESRRIMIEETANALDSPIDEDSYGQSVHNYINFDDCIIRKGATSVHKGEKAFIPYNMKDGSIFVEGKGNENWNFSAPHGAGRVMSRTEAEDTLSNRQVKQTMNNIFTTEVPLDEAPSAYKDMKLIEQKIEPTATIIDRLKPIHNLKASD